MRKFALLILFLWPLALPAAPAITVSGNSVSILGSAQTISLTCTLIDPNNTGNLHSGSNIITVFVTNTVTPGNVATCGPIYGNDVILDAFGNSNTTYYKVQVFTVTSGIVASTPSLQAFYAFTGSGTVDLSTATPLAPSFMSGANGSVAIPGSLSVTGALNATGPITCTILNVEACISPSNPQGWSGTDIIGWLTSAINCLSSNTNCPATFTSNSVGGNVRIAAGTYTTTTGSTTPILLTKPIQIIGSGWGTNIQLATGAGSNPLLWFKPNGISGFVLYGLRIQDLQLSSGSPGLGTYALQIDTVTTGSLRDLVIEHIYAGCPITGTFTCAAGSSFGTGSINFNNPTGTGGLYHSGIYRSTLFGNLNMIRVGDQITMFDNKLRQNANGDQQYVDFFPGSTIFFHAHNINEIPFQAGCATAGSGAMNGGIFAFDAWEPQSSALTGSHGAMVDLQGCAASNVVNVKVQNSSFQLSANSSTLNGLNLNFATQTDIGGRGAENQFFITTGGSCAAHTCQAYHSTAVNSFANRFNHNIYSPNTWAGVSGAIFDDVAGNTVVPDDAIFNGGASPLCYQASGGGLVCNGFNGVFISGSNNAGHITDSTVAANDAIVTSNVPLAVSTPSGMQTGFLVAGGTQPTVTGTGTCATVGTPLGGMWSGSIVCTGASGAATITFTFSKTAPNFWKCEAYDATTFADALVHGTHTTTSCTFSAAALVANDVIAFSSNMY